MSSAELIPPDNATAFAAWLRARGWSIEPLSAGMTLDADLLDRLAEPLEDSVWLNPLDPLPLWFTATDGDPLPQAILRARQLARVLPGALVVGRSTNKTRNAPLPSHAWIEMSSCGNCSCISASRRALRQR
jgi:hypothetical protein